MGTVKKPENTSPWFHHGYKIKMKVNFGGVKNGPTYNRRKKLSSI